jgi:hypothetical protein
MEITPLSFRAIGFHELPGGIRFRRTCNRMHQGLNAACRSGIIPKDKAGDKSEEVIPIDYTSALSV